MEEKSIDRMVFILGSQKAGTTTLAALLGQNGHICVCEPKEPNYYSVNYDRGRDWYLSKFVSLNRVCVDASTTYSMQPLTESSLRLKPGRHRLKEVASKIANENPQAKYIYLVRDPVNRMYSNYWHNRKYGHETRGFLEAIENDPLYVETGLYSEQLGPYLAYNQKDQFLVLKFEDFTRDQKYCLKLCEQFIGVPFQNVNEGRHENSGRVYGTMGRFLIKSGFSNTVADFLPGFITNAVKNLITKPIPKLDPKVRETLKHYFRKDQENLRDQFGVYYDEYL
jgi:hypothetical protein